VGCSPYLKYFLCLFWKLTEDSEILSMVDERVRPCTLLVRQLRVQTGQKPNSILMAHLGMQEHGQQHNDGHSLALFLIDFSSGIMWPEMALCRSVDGRNECAITFKLRHDNGLLNSGFYLDVSLATTFYYLLLVIRILY